jgi:hypothetical protein
MRLTNQNCKEKYIFAIFGHIGRRQTAYSVNAEPQAATHVHGNGQAIA